MSSKKKAETPILEQEAREFLRAVMLGEVKEQKTVITKLKDGGSEAETFEAPAELETRMKAAERLLKYIQEAKNQVKQDDDERKYGIVILPQITDHDEKE